MTAPADQPPAARGHILFADDEQAARDGTAELLRRRGFSVQCVATGTAALERLRAETFDALLSDIHMPGNIGLEMIEAVPQIAAGLPVVLLTGRPSVETAARSVRLAVAAYLTKPPDTDELCGILDQAIAAYRGFRAMQEGRARLREWDEELAAIEAALRRAPAGSSNEPMSGFLRVTLRHVILTLSDIERATSSIEQMPQGREAIARVDLVAALRRVVDVLEKTKRSFKSRDLAELRKEIEQMLASQETGTAPRDPSATTPAS